MKDCEKRGWEYTIHFNEGYVMVDVCDTHSSTLPMREIMKLGKFYPRPGKSRRRFRDLMYE